MNEMELQRRVREETARRLDVIADTPGAVLRYDRNGDGKLDDDEWRLMRSLVESEVVRELLAADTDVGAEDADEEEVGLATIEDWTVEMETVDPHIDLPVLEVLDRRYEILKELGRGSQGNTWLARVRESGDYVAVKELSFANLDSWKSLELFDREVDVLQSLDHPAIPRFVDSFHVDVEGEPTRFFLVQSFVRGESLDVLIARGERFSEEELVEFSRGLLDVLGYLHGLIPPVVHRDVKPSNIIRTEKGGYALVDFGGVQLLLPDDIGGSTVIGTTGYMPPEQLTGRACPQSDLYALGCTLVHLVTHVSPSKLPQERLRLSWRNRANLRGPLADFIDELIEPVVEDRPARASDALERLRKVGHAPATAASGALVAANPRALVAPELRAAVSARELRRIQTKLTGVTVDLTPSRRELYTNLGLFLTVGGIVGAVAFGWGAAIAVIFASGILISSLGPPARERLEVRPGGVFELTKTSDKNTNTITGRLLGTSVSGQHVVLQTEGRTIECGEGLGRATRDLIAAEVSRYLTTDDD